LMWLWECWITHSSPAVYGQILIWQAAEANVSPGNWPSE
jgi:hypothetical protein